MLRGGVDDDETLWGRDASGDDQPGSRDGDDKDDVEVDDRWGAETCLVETENLDVDGKSLVGTGSRTNSLPSASTTLEGDGGS